MNERQVLDVFHDGACPVCQMEIRFYDRIDKASAIRWIDICALADTDLPSGKTRDDLLGRFHVRDSAGAWHIGVAAFARIWRVLPGFRHFAWLFSVPGVRHMAELGYRGFLLWQRRHRANRAEMADQPNVG